ncbi:MAG: 23S rRNA (pseudouridine(1915)-N(3))-methyltransferase RlmH [Methanoregulaceae archaeon]|jgi:23S rRNA (pseudouridine1915-N3)-methyltransferase|nr:23S rRNA (pseudouridine(1915)-N(3))-methyltransferase RlmH [Methanoregulaceae archaeon]
MQIQIVAIGKIRESYLREGIGVYSTRLSRLHKISLLDLPEERISAKSSESEKRLAIEKEGRKLMAAAPDTSVIVALDPTGAILSSPELSARIAEWELKGQGNISFFIGGPFGLSPEVISHADLVLSLSRMTFPHELVRLMLIEQIYRADCIRKGIPYHK